MARARGDSGVFVNAQAIDGLLVQRSELLCIERCTDGANDVELTGHFTARLLDGLAREIGAGSLNDVIRAFALRDLGFETIMVNSNPETVSTDYDTSDKLYFEPLTLEDVLNIYDQELPEGVIVQFGGQTPLNLAEGLQAAGVPIIGTQPESI